MTALPKPKTTWPRHSAYGAKPGTADRIGATCGTCKYIRSFRGAGRLHFECLIAKEKNDGRFAGSVGSMVAACAEYDEKKKRGI